MPEKVLSRVAGAFTGSAGAGGWGCLPGRPDRRPPRLPVLERGKIPEAKLGAEDLLVLDFASLALNRGGQVDGEPTEMVVSMRPGRPTREGVGAMVGLMNKVLDLPDVYGWFAVTFDFRSLAMPCHQLDMALHVMRWDREPGWQARCMCHCVHCLILVEASNVAEAKRQLSGWYSFRPPPYCTYLATETANDVGGDDAIRFSPPECWPLPALAPEPKPSPVPPSPGSSAPSTPVPMPGVVAAGWAARGAGAPRCAGVVTGTGTGGCAAERRFGEPREAEGSRAAAATAAAPPPGGAEGSRAVAAVAAPPPGGVEAEAAPAKLGVAPSGDMPHSLDAGFVFLSNFERKDGCRELLIQCRDREMTDEALEEALGYMDVFVKHDVALKGFAVCYDLRGLRMPTISMVMRIAEWGNHPERVERFHRLNISCKIVFSPGLAYAVGKGLVGLFFSHCPPVVRTYVLTDPDEPEEHAVHYDPAEPPPAAPAARAEAAARWAREARLPNQEELVAAAAVAPLLDVGFASLALSVPPGRGPCEFRLRAGSGTPSREGAAALFMLLCDTLSLPQVCGDFTLTFDLREAERLQEGLELVLRARRWAGSPEWSALCACRCVAWRVELQAAAQFKEAHNVLDCFFYLHPPACPVQLLVGADGSRSGAAAGTLAEWRRGGNARGGGPPGDGGLRGLILEDCVDISNGWLMEALAAPPWRGSGLPRSFDAGFLRLSHSPGQLTVRAGKGQPTEEGLGMVLAFVDDFCRGPNAEGGFAARFDLRALRLPSLAAACQLASWGAEPERRERWQRLCMTCVVVAGPGQAFLLAKGLLSKFLSLCPPVCRTFLIEDPDPAELETVRTGALCFEPDPAEPEAVGDAGDGEGADGALEPPRRYTLGLAGRQVHPDDDPWVF